MTTSLDMEARELRIGNWVNVKCIEPIIGEHYVINEIEAEDLVNFSDNNFSPILLTEEWLIKFYIKKLSKKTWFISKGIILVNHSKGFYISINTNRIFIKHVHTLQNLYFALTGEELEIKN